MGKGRKRKRKIILASILFLILASGITGFVLLRNSILKPVDLQETSYVYIDKNKNFEQVVAQLNELGLPSEKVFRFLAERMKYDAAVKSGRYAITDRMNTLDIVRLLRSGMQTPVNLTFNNIRFKDNLAGRLSQQLMIDSITLLDALNDDVLIDSLGFDEYTYLTMFIPNTYQVYWDTEPESLIKRMKREYDKFWNDSRMAKAEALNLSPVQVSVLASIVEEEATYADEYPTVAGLYLNRLRKGMRLEADPTVKFAIGDLTLRRILYKHLEVDSPYNTYKVDGLPPGPIRIPDIRAIDAVLTPQEHNYLFMCAKDDLSGRHNFATTHAEHSRNAARYQQALNRMGIYK